MKSQIYQPLQRNPHLVVQLTLIMLSLLGCERPDQPLPLKQRAIFPKPTSATVNPDFVSVGHVILKFHEGTHIRLRSGIFVFDSKKITKAEKLLCERVDLSNDRIQSDIDEINDILHKNRSLHVSRHFFLQGEEQLAANKAKGESMSGEELADLDLYYNIFLDEPDASKATDLINSFNRFSSVEVAYPQPIPRGADVDIPPKTIISPPLSQGYLSSSIGIDAIYAWNYPGGKGAGVKLVDVEPGFHLDHEDLPALGAYFFGNGINNPVDKNHGTAVLGILASPHNEFGINGIVPDVTYGWSSPIIMTIPFSGIPYYSVALAIHHASSALSFGDVLLIEQHFWWFNEGPPCPGNCNDLKKPCDQYGWTAVENWQADFDAIRNATARGIIVVEAAGNGQQNLDAAHFGGRFNRLIRDSGAILVGAGAPRTRAPLCFSNFGSRVDLQGWGRGVATLGYGEKPDGSPDPNLRINGNDARQWYYGSFSGTSSASPIVAGAVCAIQGILIARGAPKLSPIEMRSLLSRTGTSQPPPPTTITRPIGPLPNLRRAINEIIPTFLMQNGTGLHETDQNWDFEIADWDKDGNLDLFAINRAGGSKKTEVHILSGASNYKNFIIHAETGLHETSQNWDFEIADWDKDGNLDLFAINRVGGSKKTEVHILSGASNYKNFIMHAETGLHETDQNWDFNVADWDRDNNLDLIVVKKRGTGTKTTEIHILSGASNYRDFILRTGTGLHETNANWQIRIIDWNKDNKLDMFSLALRGTGSKTTEVHILEVK